MSKKHEINSLFGATVANASNKINRKEARFAFWRQFLTNAVVNLIDIENMETPIETMFKMTTLIFGRSVFFRDKDGILRCLPFSDGGEVPVYMGQIVKMLVVNPVIGEYRFNVEDTDNAPVYLTPLDRCQFARGFSILIDAYADELSDNDLSVRMVQMLKRLPVVFIGRSDNELAAIQAILDSVEQGEMNIKAQSSLAGMLERLDAGQSILAPLSEFTEYQQYKLGQFYNMLGVNSVWNLKREKVAAAENDTSAETARYNIADIVDYVNEQLDVVNERFDTRYRARLNILKAAEIAAEVAEKSTPETTEPEETPVEGDTEPEEGNEK